MRLMSRYNSIGAVAVPEPTHRSCAIIVGTSGMAKSSRGAEIVGPPAIERLYRPGSFGGWNISNAPGVSGRTHTLGTTVLIRYRLTNQIESIHWRDVQPIGLVLRQSRGPKPSR
jgi:hypothetical protein